MKLKKSFQKKIILALSLGVVSTFTPAYASDFDDYLHSIESGNEAQRVIARQMLPRAGMRAVPPLIELLQHEDQLVWRNARNILSDIVNEVAAAPIDDDMAQIIDINTRSGKVKKWEKRKFDALPSNVRDRVEVTRQLMVLVNAEDTPPHAVQEGLRLLGIVTPEGYDITPLKALMQEPECRGEVISALHVMGTSTSRFLVANNYTRGAGSVGLPPLTHEGTHEGYVSLLKENEEGLLAGGNWDKVIQNYLDGLSDWSNSRKGSAITALGRFGDETVIPAVMTALKADPELEAPALMGLDDMFGLAAYEGLLTAYPDTGFEMQLGLLGVFGRKQNAIFLPLLLENAGSEDVARQTAAFDALIQSNLPGGVDAVVKYVAGRPEDDRKFEVMDLLAYADRLHNKGAKIAAGKAYLGLYRTASHEDDKDIAFHGIKRYPSPEAYEIILADLDLEALDEVSTETLIALNVMLKKESNPEAFDKIRAALYEAVKSTGNVQMVLSMAAQQGSSDQFLSLLGFVRDWHVIGSFPWSKGEAFTANPIAAPAVDLKATYTVDGKTLAWREHRSGQIISCDGLFGGQSNASMYAYTILHSDKAMDAQLRVGSDDGVRVWINGESVLENNVDRGMALDQEIIDVKLQQGENKVLLQITQGGGGWGFMLRVTQRDGTPINQ